MALKFEETSWDIDSKLMYVQFNHNGRHLRWYPKWIDVADLINSTFATESTSTNGRLLPYLNFIVLEILLRQEIPYKVSIKEANDFNKAIEKIKEKLLEKDH
jgi:hypothetical protein